MQYYYYYLFIPVLIVTVFEKTGHIEFLLNFSLQDISQALP